MTRYGSPPALVDGVDRDDVVVARPPRRPAPRGRTGARAVALAASRGASTLIATNRLSAGSNALSTTPIPPRPITSVTS